MKTKNLLALIITFQLAFSGCEEAEFRSPLDSNNEVPQAISEFGYESLAGAAKLLYKVPDDPNIAQITATYTLSTGLERTVSASVYSDYLILDGFADQEEHEVVVKTVSKSGVESNPTVTQVKAAEAAIWKVKREIEFTDQFGGFNITGTNSDEATVYVFVMERNSFDEFEVNNFKSFATSFATIERRIRGLDTLTYEYKYFIMDKWENSTDTTLVTVNPLYETIIPKTGYASFRLPGDAPMVTNGATIEMAWDGVVDSWPGALFTSQELGGSSPHMITVDLGREVQLSRFWYRAYPEFWYDASQIQFFFLTTMREFELYGSVAPNPNGALDETWFKIDEYEVIKPSGSPYGADTPEDIEAGRAGFDFEIDASLPRLRYVRIRCLRNWADGTAMSINELEFYGDPR